MQTFLPYPSFRRSARCLDRQRLGKQRVEAFQILVALGDPWALRTRAARAEARGEPVVEPRGWKRHPAVLQWVGAEECLSRYMNEMISEWVRRGYLNTMGSAPRSGWGRGRGHAPAWLGRPAVHASHRAALLRKNPEWYEQFGWTDSVELPIVWGEPGKVRKRDE